MIYQLYFIPLLFIYLYIYINLYIICKCTYTYIQIHTYIFIHSCIYYLKNANPIWYIQNAATVLPSIMPVSRRHRHACVTQTQAQEVVARHLECSAAASALHPHAADINIYIYIINYTYRKKKNYTTRRALSLELPWTAAVSMDAIEVFQPRRTSWLKMMGYLQEIIFLIFHRKHSISYL